MNKLSKLKILEYAREGAVDTLGRNSGRLSGQEEIELEKHISELVRRIQKAKNEVSSLQCLDRSKRDAAPTRYGVKKDQSVCKQPQVSNRRSANTPRDYPE